MEETGVVMQPVKQRVHWRVQKTGPLYPARYVGKFDSEAEAERWIAEHRWLTKQSPERRQETPNEAATDAAPFVLQVSAVVESVAWCKAGCTGMARK
jgi:hypothetical protein